MRKTQIMTILVITMLLVLGACTPASMPEPTPGPSPTPEPPPAPTPEPPPAPAKKLRVVFLSAYYEGTEFIIEGAIQNKGNVPLASVMFEVALWPEESADPTYYEALTEPSYIPVDGRASCRIKLQSSRKFRTYDYRFTLPSGEPIEIVGEKPY